MATIRIFGKNIYYEVYGEQHDRTLVYFHGGPGASCLDFAAQARELGRQVRVILFDQYGVLRSDPVAEEEPYGMVMQAAMIEEMRRLLHVEQWSVLGHSYGGMLACLYARTYPSAVSKLILDCPSLDFVDSARSIARYMSGYIAAHGSDDAKALVVKMQSAPYAGTAVVDDLLALLGHIHDMQLRNYLHGVTFEEYAKVAYTESFPEEMWRRSQTHLEKLIGEGKMLESFLPMLKEISAPILLVNGLYDPACSDSQIRYIREHIPNARQVLFENSGHFPRIEEAAKYTQCVLDFLTQP
ncbi:MAG: alpha/beta hydrolase [Christensenellaceae bacterium]|nr:alpha/beta hydrolase [Christensenellaceae bacterium]